MPESRRTTSAAWLHLDQAPGRRPHPAATAAAAAAAAGRRAGRRRRRGGRQWRRKRVGGARGS
eukprot:scaffold28540_cov51-Isochrysis_galbana.AAC.1